jgi:hypothetical protein
LKCAIPEKRKAVKRKAEKRKAEKRKVVALGTSGLQSRAAVPILA